MKITGLIGVPGSGKSTFFRKNILDKMENKVVVKFFHGTKRQPITMTLDPQLRYAVFGVYEEGEQFPGTDKLSKSCGPAVRELLTELASGTETMYLAPGVQLDNSWSFFWEGERFSNNPMFQHLISLRDTGVVVETLFLNPPQETLARNRQGRVQNEKWLQGMETRIKNLVSKYGEGLQIKEIA